MNENLKDLNNIVQNLSNRTNNYSVDQIINELTIIAERLSFAEFDPTKSKSNIEVMKLLDYLLGRDISPGMMAYVKFLADNNQLGVLQRESGKTFIEYCTNYFSEKKQLVMSCPINLSPDKQKRIAVNLLKMYPVSSRVIFEVDPTIIAGFVLYEDGAKVSDHSLRSRATLLIEEFIRKRNPIPWTQTT